MYSKILYDFHMLKSTKWSAKKIGELKTISFTLIFFSLFHAEDIVSKEEKRLDELVKTLKEGLAEIEKTVKDKKGNDKESQVKPQALQADNDKKTNKIWESLTIFLKVVELPIILLEGLFYSISEIAKHIYETISTARNTFFK